jgi:hypothetical protein
VSISLQRHLLKQLSVPAKTKRDKESGLAISQSVSVMVLLKIRASFTTLHDLEKKKKKKKKKVKGRKKKPHLNQRLSRKLGLGRP